jgi:hypothetical protein
MPLTKPVEEPTVAIPGMALIQTPPVLVSVSVVVDPAHSNKVPDIRPGTGFTVTVVVTMQPVDIE